MNEYQTHAALVESLETELKRLRLLESEVKRLQELNTSLEAAYEREVKGNRALEEMYRKAVTALRKVLERAPDTYEVRSARISLASLYDDQQALWHIKNPHHIPYVTKGYT